jgi:hypothetical protein
MSDRDGLRRRAEVLQRVADQLSAQLRVERWSNGELRKLLGEPVEPGFDEERVAARRFVTFASVAIVTAAAVALLASNPWRGQDTLPTSDPVVVAPFVGSSVGGTIIPFTVISSMDAPSDKPARALRGHRNLAPSAYAVDMIFGRPGAGSRSSHDVPGCEHAGPLGPQDIFGPTPARSPFHVP